jgi:hypothetical protein
MRATALRESNKERQEIVVISQVEGTNSRAGSEKDEENVLCDQGSEPNNRIYFN